MNVEKADLGEIALSLVDVASLIFASPAVLSGAHPNIIYTTYLANSLKPKAKYCGIIGSFNWGSKLVDQITDLLKGARLDFYEPVLVKGLPGKDDYSLLDNLTEKIIARHKELS